MQPIWGELVSWHMICWNAITQTSRVDCFLFPLALGEFALTFQKSASVVRLWNVPTPPLWSCECVGSSFYDLYNVSSLSLDTGCAMWLSSLLKAAASLAGWPGEPWFTVWLSIHTVVHDTGLFHSSSCPHPWNSWVSLSGDRVLLWQDLWLGLR
jgi:hypothetical protein